VWPGLHRKDEIQKSACQYASFFSKETTNELIRNKRRTALLDRFCILASRDVCPLHIFLLSFVFSPYCMSYCSSFFSSLPLILATHVFRTIAYPPFKVQTFPRRLRTSVHLPNSSRLYSHHPSSRRLALLSTHPTSPIYPIQSNHAELRFHCSCSSPAPGHGRPRYVHKPVAHVDPLN
jgi:hypothetical protein